MRNSILHLFGLSLLIGLVFSCKKPVAESTDLPDSLENGLLTLNEGLFQQNNSTLTWYDLHTHTTHQYVFQTKNGLGIGDTGNDMAVYGNKIYIVVNNSHVLHVLDKRTGKLLKQLSLTNNNSGSSPRQIAFHQEFAYITAFDGSVFQLDTASISVQQIVLAGSNPEGILVHEDKLYVSNSGGLTTGGDSTISVFQLPQLSELNTIVVGRNPGKLVTDYQGSLYVVSRGDFMSIPAKLVKVDLQTNTVTSSLPIESGSIEFANGKLYLAQYISSQSISKLKRINPQNLSVEQENSIAPLNIQTLYGIQHLQILGQDVLLLTDAKNYIHQGRVLVVDLHGNLLFEFTGGLNPNKTVYISPH
jgi:hypothetical protein